MNSPGAVRAAGLWASHTGSLDSRSTVRKGAMVWRSLDVFDLIELFTLRHAGRSQPGSFTREWGLSVCECAEVRSVDCALIPPADVG